MSDVTVPVQSSPEVIRESFRPRHGPRDDLFAEAGYEILRAEPDGPILTPSQRQRVYDFFLELHRECRRPVRKEDGAVFNWAHAICKEVGAACFDAISDGENARRRVARVASLAPRSDPS